ncbi:hypothetical protein EV361DRAFT_936367 [Lentinula raphanica]|uniref:Uncharacterized protein n=1 Tax=Lentinula raphanica TaxID=153919 RepID=A0AA38P9F1_9AGAR|nr:hypothetical protein F5878DRAFT_619259 [Lentinula raphanica]KAJ3966178.1 hypothetical protein EV361DRAFT_936367 [Lentinula raphanica]
MFPIRFDLRLYSRLPHILLLAVYLLNTFNNVAARPLASVQELVPRYPPHTTEPPTEPGLYLQRYGSSTPGAVKLCLFSMDDLYHRIVCSPPPLLAGWYLTGTHIFIGNMEFINNAHRDYVFGELGKNPSGGSREAKEAETNPWEWANGKVTFLSISLSGLQDGGFVISDKIMNDKWKPILFRWTHAELEEIEVVYYDTGHVGFQVGAGYKRTFSLTGALSNPPNSAIAHRAFTTHIIPRNENEAAKQSTLSNVLAETANSRAADWFGALGLWGRRRPNWTNPWVRVDSVLESLSKTYVGFTSDDLKRWRSNAGIVMRSLHEPRRVSSERSH